MRKTWVEITCNYCGCAINHVKPGNVSAQIRACGAIVSKDGDFCSRACLTIFRGDKNDPTRKLLDGNVRTV